MKTSGNVHAKRITTAVLAFLLAFAFTLPLVGCCGCPVEREVVIDEVEDERVEENLLDRKKGGAQ